MSRPKILLMFVRTIKWRPASIKYLLLCIASIVHVITSTLHQLNDCHVMKNEPELFLNVIRLALDLISPDSNFTTLKINYTDAFLNVVSLTGPLMCSSSWFVMSKSALTSAQGIQMPSSHFPFVFRRSSLTAHSSASIAGASSHFKDN